MLLDKVVFNSIEKFGEQSVECAQCSVLLARFACAAFIFTPFCSTRTKVLGVDNRPTTVIVSSDDDDYDDEFKWAQCYHPISGS